MKKKIVANLVIVLLVMGWFQITLKVAPSVFSGQSEAHREIWKIVDVTNTHENMTTSGDIEVAVSSNEGINIAWSTNITKYFENITHWENQGYNNYLDWLNGTITLAYHWAEMDWCISEGSLTDITWNEIKYWWDMYRDSGGGVDYETFMGNNYMADCNLTYPGNDPDIIDLVPWSGSNIIIRDLVVPANKTIYFVFKIVITEPGAYSFNLTSANSLLEITPSNWMTGGVATLLVGKGAAYEYNIIQEAVNNATTGDTILVFNGTYLEALHINKTLTLKAASSTIIKGGQSVTTNYGPRDAVIFVEDAPNVVIEDFDIEGQGLGPTDKSYGVIYENSSGTLGNCTVSPNTIGDLLSQGIAAWDNSSLTVDVCKVENFGRIGIFYFSGCSGGVYDSTIIGQVYSGEGDVNYGIEVEAYDFPCNIEIVGNDIYNCSNTFSPEPTWSSVGIVLDGWHSYYDLPSSTVVIRENLIHDNYYGIEAVSNQSYAHYNDIYNNSEYGVVIDPDYLGNNKTFDARFNWWGNETGCAQAITYYEYPTLNQTGVGDNVTDYVDFEPWLMQPYPSTDLISELRVDPETTKCWAGLNHTFEVKVKLADVKLLYGFEFIMTWNDTLLDVVSTSYSELWGTLKTKVWQDNLTSGEYHLALTGLGDVTPFNGNATLATLTFEIIKEPVYPNSVNSSLSFLKTLLSRSTNLTDQERILHLVHDGFYICNYTLPQIVLAQPEYVVTWVPKDFAVSVAVQNVLNLTAFNFTLQYDSDLLKLLYDESSVLLGTTGGIGWNGNSVFAHAEGISPVVNGTRTLAIIKFRALGVVWSTENRTVSCTLEFSNTNLTDSGSNLIVHEWINGVYIYEPLPGDLNMDGEVELTDLVIAALAFGTQYTPPPYLSEDFNHDGTVDILDVIVVARNYGRH